MCSETQSVFCRILRNGAGGTKQVWQSETFRQQNKLFPSMSLTLTQLCNADKDAELIFSVHRENPNGMEIN
jgi:hypothetical protein